MVNLNLPKNRFMELDIPIHKRILSFLIDLLVLNFFIISTFTVSLKKMIPESLSITESMSYLKANPELMNEAGLLLFIVGLFSFYYLTYLQHRFRQTIGMKIFNIYLKSIEKNKEISIWQVMLRNLYIIPLFPFVLLWIIDPIYLIIYKRRFSESLSKTKLVEEHLI